LNNFFAFILGLIVGSLDWYLIYAIFKRSFCSENKKIPFVLLILKLFVFFIILYLLVITFKHQVLFIILGLTVSLIGMIFIMIRKNKEVG
jgi:hypothetical protein